MSVTTRSRRPWSFEDDDQLRISMANGKSAPAIAVDLKRTTRAVRRRTEILKLSWKAKSGLVVREADRPKPVRHFQVGDRVQLSELGEVRIPRKSSKVGTVIRQTAHKPGPASILILFDGQKEPSRLHWTYVERIDRPSEERR